MKAETLQVAAETANSLVATALRAVWETETLKQKRPYLIKHTRLDIDTTQRLRSLKSHRRELKETQGEPIHVLATIKAKTKQKDTTL